MPITIHSPVEGKTLSLKEVKDPAFAELLLGDGVAVVPSGDLAVFHAPCDGELTTVFRTAHAYIVRAEDKVDVLVHIGVDTNMLKGEGFKILKEQGEKVKAGDPVIQVDLAFLRSKGKETSAPVLISNMDEIKGIENQLDSGKDVNTKTALFQVNI